MVETILAINFGGQELLIILLIVVLLFGASRLPQLAKALGQSKRAFRGGMDDADEGARLDSKRRASLRSADEEVRRDDVASEKFTVDKPR